MPVGMRAELEEGLDRHGSRRVRTQVPPVARAAYG